MLRLSFCKKGHDTSFPEARDSQYHCRECQRENDREYRRGPKKKASNRRYKMSPKGRYGAYKNKLRRRIRLKKEKIELLETELKELLDA